MWARVERKVRREKNKGKEERIFLQMYRWHKVLLLSTVAYAWGFLNFFHLFSELIMITHVSFMISNIKARCLNSHWRLSKQGELQQNNKLKHSNFSILFFFDISTINIWLLSKYIWLKLMTKSSIVQTLCRLLPGQRQKFRMTSRWIR